jgi:DNA primase large subunit
MEESKITPYIPFYKSAPTKIINLDELETLCFKRVACLKMIELESEAGDEFEKVHNRIKNKLKKQDVELKLFEGQDAKAIEDDNIAHFMLRLAYCRSDEYRRWVITQETRLFRHILFAQTEKNQHRLKQLLNDKKITYEEVGREEWDQLKYRIAFDKLNPNDEEVYNNLLLKLKTEKSSDEIENIKLNIAEMNKTQEEVRRNYFKFDFLNGLALVGKRRCFVHQGYIYLHSSQLFTIISEEFKKELKEVLQFTYRHLPVIVKDPRLAELLKYVSRKELLEFEYDEKTHVTGKVNLANIDFYAKSVHYPPCMKFLHEKLSEDHHLKHYGRLQYGLFLKGVGLTLDESMQLWKKKFAGKIDGDKFEKQYSYNIRHSYGKEGKRTDYTPWSCSKIISQIPGANEYHGCPFKYFKDEVLNDFLHKKYHLSSDKLLPIMDKKREGACQVACIKLWDATHEVDTKDNVGNHPNAFFSSSLE